ncbi:MAG: hypothetical protein V4717_20570 [Bacteroidota bacterium]
MSYDLYCYKSKIGRPDLEEAQAVIEVKEEEAYEDGQPGLETKLKIVKALMDFNPRLESFEFDYNEIAKLEGTTVDEAKEQFDHIELNTPNGDLATQITIFNNNVLITIPYWYSGDKAKTLFTSISEYTKIIHKTAGYFVYDPQTENVYDPTKNSFDNLEVYTSMTGEVDNMQAKLKEPTTKKPWWKFW